MQRYKTLERLALPNGRFIGSRVRFTKPTTSPSTKYGQRAEPKFKGLL